MGEVTAIWIKRFKLGPMDRVAEAELVEGLGIRGNANQGGRRQITIIDEAAWRAAVEDVGALVDPSARRANVMLRGVDLEQSRGRIIRLGDCRVLIQGETKPCDRMDEARPGLRNALGPRWRGGAYGEILSGGVLRIGDPAEILPESEAQPPEKEVSS